ncbi:acyl-CoA thioester hydrolase, YbgC/YbaW family [Treponema sp. JC4]|uniref:acyl-CoA thioesterase n=1 Tax=Treponema sp. JC4 TaxID=1124982 RepID=UPI00025B028D|nr:thioesterase family protein [Treponema sp. JC4]EID86331.1 acyl-CoA thioester hydrolase, YbgC/YbaW family [Treponema sp. JC4]
MDFYVKNEITFPVEFYDVDTMRVVWHGNYVKYIEKARCALLNSVNFGYLEMEKCGTAFPVVDMKLKYVRSLRFGDTVRVISYLTEYENCIKIKYEIYNAESGELCTKAESTQMAMSIATSESSIVCPQIFIDNVKKYMEGK